MAYNPPSSASVRLPIAGPLQVIEDAPLRPGAMDAYRIPTLIQGVRVERKRPILMAASPVNGGVK